MTSRSFFGKLKSVNSPLSPSPGNVPTKKDPNALQPTPLEKLLYYAGPIREDGSDKFFGFENFGSTCYCNSIIQCLYYSTPFRDQVINFPGRTPQELITKRLLDAARSHADPPSQSNAANTADSPAKGKHNLAQANQAQSRKSGLAAPAQSGPGTKAEDNKDSPEYKKKQALAVGPILNMDYENSRDYGMTESLFTSLKDIFEAIIAHQSRVGVVSPNKFLEILRKENEIFRTAMHQDAHEFLNLLLNEVVENVDRYSKQSKSDSGQTDSHALSASNTVVFPSKDLSLSSSNTGWVHELFEGTLTSETRCLTCENVSQRDEVFLDLSVDLDQHSSVTSCLRKFSEEEMLCERDKFHCDKCSGLQEAEKRMKIKRLPRILALHLKRFKYTEDLARLQKLFHRVVYPYFLRLFNTTDDAEDPDRLYELYAVVVHIGSGPYHGHYVSIIKTQDRGWLLFDDEMVEPVDKSYVRNFFGGEGTLACAYVLFYQETTMEAMLREQEAEGLAAAKSAADAKTDAALSNGFHHSQHPATPVDEGDHFANLDHAVTAPPQAQTSVTQPLEPAATSPILGIDRKNTSQSKKERQKEEKEKKAAEKELEKQAKQQRKEKEQKRLDNFRKQEEEMRAAVAASKLTKAEEDKKLGPGEDRLAKESTLSRFRQSSKSLRQKPKFWTKDKSDTDYKDTNDKSSSPTGDEKPPVIGAVEPQSEKQDRSKNRFSIGRKKSSVLQ